MFELVSMLRMILESMVRLACFDCNYKVGIALILFFAETAHGQDAVTLGSTLKQGALCAGERTATITCTAVGTDLNWLVDGRMMAYNANADVGAIRSNAQSDITSILMRVESRGDGSGVASRMSVLVISELPSARDPLTVACHNGSTEIAQEITFWRRQAGTLNMPHVDLRLVAERVHLNWTIPELNEQVHTVTHYSVQVDDALPILVKNTSADLFIEQLNISNHTIQLTAIDGCNQQGGLHIHNFTTAIKPSPSMSTHESDLSTLPARDYTQSIACPQMPYLPISILIPLHVLTKHSM